MLMSALLSIWSSDVFPESPSRGFSATLFVFGVGLTAGPASFGALAASFGLEAMFLVAAAVTLLTALARPKGTKVGKPPTDPPPETAGPPTSEKPVEDTKKSR